MGVTMYQSGLVATSVKEKSRQSLCSVKQHTALLTFAILAH